MTRKTRAAIETMGRKLKTEDWSLINDSIRCTAIADRASNVELVLCPLAMAVARVPVRRITELAHDGRHTEFREGLDIAMQGMQEHLHEEDPGLAPEMAGGLAIAYGAASLVQASPQRAETAELLGLDATTVDHIATAADNAGGRVGRALAAALASDDNWLARQHAERYGAAAD